MTGKDEIKIGKTPEGQTVAETPEVSAPGVERQFQGVYGKWLGDPDRRYGRLISSRSIPAHTKIEMLADPVVALCQGYVGSTLVRAKRIIECVDEKKRLFFEAMFQAWEQEFMLQASMAVALGSCGLIKKFAFQRPAPRDIGAAPVWTARADPLIITGFDQLYPVGSSPKFDNKNRHFEGMNTPDGPIDVYYSLWLTINKAWGFGSYQGWGRLRNVYRDWWMKQFGRDLYLVHLQKAIDRIALVGFPSGKTNAGKAHKDIAIETGDSARSGATVALPSSVYEQQDTMTGEKKLMAAAKWTLKFLEGSHAVAEFHTVDDHHDSKIALAYLVPPQMFMYVRQSSLGGPTTAEVLGDLAEHLLMLDAADIDAHINKYVFPPVARANFPPDSPPVRVRTIGLEPDARAGLLEIVTSLFNRAEVDALAYFDLSEGVRRLGLPQPADVLQVEPGGDGDGEGDDDLPGPEGRGELRAAAGEEEGLPSRETLEAIVADQLPPVPTRAVIPSDAEQRRAWRQLRAALPEIFEEDDE
jgi:hypothetical protein